MSYGYRCYNKRDESIGWLYTFDSNKEFAWTNQKLHWCKSWKTQSGAEKNFQYYNEIWKLKSKGGHLKIEVMPEFQKQEAVITKSVSLIESEIALMNSQIEKLESDVGLTSIKQEEKLKSLQLAIKILIEIESLTADDYIKEQIIDRVLSTVNIQSSRKRKHNRGAQDKIIQALRYNGGQATRADIVSATALDPNVVSSLLSKLAKQGMLQKKSLEKSAITRSGRGLKPDYIYVMLENQDN